MSKILKKVGFWKEYSRNAHDGSLYDLKFDEEFKNNTDIVKYLESGVMIIAASYTEYCLLSGQVDMISPSKYIFTDGEWLWTSELIFYMKKYGVALPSDFLSKMKNLQFVCPTKKQIGVKRLGELDDEYWLSFVKI